MGGVGLVEGPVRVPNPVPVARIADQPAQGEDPGVVSPEPLDDGKDPRVRQVGRDGLVQVDESHHRPAPGRDPGVPGHELGLLGLQGTVPGGQDLPPHGVHPVRGNHVLQQKPPVIAQPLQQRLDHDGIVPDARVHAQGREWPARGETAKLDFGTIRRKLVRAEPLNLKELRLIGRMSFQCVSARGKSRHGIRPSLHPGGLRCDSGTYSRYAPESRLVRRAQEQSRCSRDFHHGLIWSTQPRVQLPGQEVWISFGVLKHNRGR